MFFGLMMCQQIGWIYWPISHSWIGWGYLNISAMLIVSGLVSRRVLHTFKWKTDKAINIKFIHRVIGWIAIFCG